MVTTLQNTIDFLTDFGFFSVIVPFLLFFAISFAILEKTKLLGKDKSNVNLIVALAVSLLVIATDKIVPLVSEVIPNLILMLVLFIMFIMILGLFFKEGEMEFAKEHKNWFRFFMVLIFVITLLFILNAWPTEDGNVLRDSIDSISDGSTEDLVGGIVLALIVIGAVALVVGTKSKKSDEGG